MTKHKYWYSHKILRFYILDCIVYVSKSFEHSTHSKSTFSIQFPFFPSRIHFLISFRSYTVSCITHLDNSVYSFHPSSPSSSFHTPYQSASTMLCNTSYASFFNKYMHIAIHPFSTQVKFRFDPFLHLYSNTFITSILD